MSAAHGCSVVSRGARGIDQVGLCVLRHVRVADDDKQRICDRASIAAIFSNVEVLLCINTELLIKLTSPLADLVHDVDESKDSESAASSASARLSLIIATAFKQTMPYFRMYFMVSRCRPWICFLARPLSHPMLVSVLQELPRRFGIGEEGSRNQSCFCRVFAGKRGVGCAGVAL